MSSVRTVLVAVGNPLMGDDAAGYCVGLALEKCGSIDARLVVLDSLEPGAIHVLDGAETVVFIDAMETDHDVVVLELDPSRLEPMDVVEAVEMLDPHNVNPINLLVLAYASGVFRGKAYLIGFRVERVSFAKPVAEQTRARSLKAIKILQRLLEKLGVRARIEMDCAAETIEECGSGIVEIALRGREGGLG